MNVKRFVGGLVALGVAIGMSLSATPAVAESLLLPPGPSGKAVEPGSVGIQMFMHNWKSVASECTSVLGPAGVKWVMVMPPQEHITGSAWWTHYQPVSYRIESRLGTRAEFAAMTAACNAAGVNVIADAVINHMSASAAGVGWAGSSYTKYNYPGLYAESDFHACRAGIAWGDATSVRSCELLGLADLDTGSSSVRGKIVSYLNDLLSLGVSGFRIDAAKHIAVDELAAIRAALPASVTFLNEVYNGDGIRADDYLGVGDIFDFNSAYELKSILEYPGKAGLLNAKKQTLVALPPSEQTITMVTNHDTERGGKTLTYNDGKAYVLANLVLLSRNYGIPMLYSGYAFTDRDSAPLGADGKVVSAGCSKAKTAVQSSYGDGRFFCTQRWKAVRGMINWHNFVGAEPETHGYGKRGIYGVGRGALGYFAVNSGTKTASLKLTTGLAPGVYCDLVSAGTNPFKGGVGSGAGSSAGSGAKRKCAGLTVKVDAKKRLIAKVKAQTAVAITAASKR